MKRVRLTCPQAVALAERLRQGKQLTPAEMAMLLNHCGQPGEHNADCPRNDPPEALYSGADDDDM